MEEEKFLDLLEQYLDDEEIELKKKLDKESDDIKKISTNSPFSIENTIPIGQFANEYLKMDGDCSNLYHSSLKEFGNKYLIGVDNNFANKNPELVYQNYLLLVIDAHHNRGTYINPYFIKQFLKNDDIEKEYNIFIKQRIKDLNQLVEYYCEYRKIASRLEINQKFFQVLEETNKVGKIKRLKMEGNEEND